MIARLNCVTDEAQRRFRQRGPRPGWPLSLRDSDGTATAALCEDIAVPKDCQARPSPNLDSNLNSETP
jgi:hypothetical protein